jgi:hypothetical protein
MSCTRPVIGFDAADLVVSNGAAVAFSGSLSTFTFVVTPAGQGPVTVALAAGVCTNVSGTPNSAAVPLSRTYDSLSPTVADVSSPTADGVYGPGAIVVIRVSFFEPVLVTGTPQLTLETGSADAVVNYSSGSGTATLTFQYTAAAGHTSPDLDYVGTGSLALNGGSIRDAAGNSAALTLPAPGTAHSLGANSALVVAAVGAPNGPFLARMEAAGVAQGRGWWDLTGSYVTSVAGHPLSLTLVEDSQGRITGTALIGGLDAGRKGLIDLSLPVKGSVKGSGGAVLLKLTIRGADSAGTVRVALSLPLTLDAEDRQLRGPASGSIRAVAGTTVVTDSLGLALPASMDGTWSLLFELRQGTRSIGGTATLMLPNGVQRLFAVNGRASGSMAVLRLTGHPTDPEAARVSIRTTIETIRGALTDLTVFSGKGYGQTVWW